MSGCANEDLRNKYPNQFSDRENRAFAKFIRGLQICDELEDFSIGQAAIFLSEISSLPGEVAQSLVVWLLHQNLPQSTLDFILGSDIDGDGISLKEELANGTNPFQHDHPEKTKHRDTQNNRARSSIEIERG
jgi:hypothetical protein